MAPESYIKPIHSAPLTWTQTIWNALEDYRENNIPEGTENHDDQWDEICTAMAWIQSGLGVVDPSEVPDECINCEGPINQETGLCDECNNFELKK